VQERMASSTNTRPKHLLRAITRRLRRNLQ
jgi:hypothetical protein